MQSQRFNLGRGSSSKRAAMHGSGAGSPNSGSSSSGDAAGAAGGGGLPSDAPPSQDFHSKLLHLAWHPEANLIAAAASNSLYMYCAQ